MFLKYLFRERERNLGLSDRDGNIKTYSLDETDEND